jgi:tetratricopeptide (TPR) repeat protein
VIVGCCLAISHLSPVRIFQSEAFAAPATPALQGTTGNTAAPASSPAASPAPLVFEPTVKSLDAIWAARHEVHPQIVDFLKKKHTLQDNYEVLWRMSRMAYYGGFFALPKDATSEDKQAIFLVGSEAGDKARKLDPSRVEGHYWYAVTLGGWGIAKGILKALNSAGPMKDALSEAIKIDPKYHYAGPYRIRGRLYNKIPGMISFGDNQKAAEDLRKAISLAPESKLNHVYMAEVQAKIQSKAEALKTLEYARSLPDVVGVAEEAAYRRDISELENKFR